MAIVYRFKVDKLWILETKSNNRILTSSQMLVIMLLKPLIFRFQFKKTESKENKYVASKSS